MAEEGVDLYSTRRRSAPASPPDELMDLVRERLESGALEEERPGEELQEEELEVEEKKERGNEEMR